MNLFFRSVFLYLRSFVIVEYCCEMVNYVPEFILERIRYAMNHKSS